MDATDLRLFKQAPDGETFMTLWGYPDDEGIIKNNGRPGAAEAPARIIEILGKMTPSASWPPHVYKNLGLLPINKKTFNERATMIRSLVTQHLKNFDDLLVTLGGGHDFGSPDGAGFLDACLSGTKAKAKPVILNLDAHLDVRPIGETGRTSGTPFRELLIDFEGRFELVEVGIQQQCNSPEHWAWAQNMGARVLSLNDLRSRGTLAAFEKVMKGLAGRECFLSFDIDVFCSSLAPGCSASWPGGLTWEEWELLGPWIFENLDVKMMGIYEVSPPLDRGDQTSRLAAKIIYQALAHRIAKSGKLAGKGRRR